MYRLSFNANAIVVNIVYLFFSSSIFLYRNKEERKKERKTPTKHKNCKTHSRIEAFHSTSSSGNQGVIPSPILGHWRCHPPSPLQNPNAAGTYCYYFTITNAPKGL